MSSCKSPSHTWVTILMHKAWDRCKTRCKPYSKPQSQRRKRSYRLIWVCWGYYRKFLPNLSSQIIPLTELLRAEHDSAQGRGSRKTSRASPADQKLKWGQKQQKAFAISKQMLESDSLISGHFTKDCFGPDSTRSFFWSIGRIFAKIVGNLRALSSTTLYLRGKIWRDRLSPPRVRYRKSDRLLFLNILKNSSQSKTVSPWSSWSSEGPLKVP